MNPRPKPQPKPKPTNLMEEVISIKHDEGVVENPCLYRVAREWAARLEVSQMAASQMIVAFLQSTRKSNSPELALHGRGSMSTACSLCITTFSFAAKSSSNRKTYAKTSAGSVPLAFSYVQDPESAESLGC